MAEIHEAIERLRDPIALIKYGDYQADLDVLVDAYRELSSALDWGVTCLNCANLLDASIRDTVRAEEAEAEVARLDAENTALRAENATIQRAWDTAFDRGVEAGSNDAERDALRRENEQLRIRDKHAWAQVDTLHARIADKAALAKMLHDRSHDRDGCPYYPPGRCYDEERSKRDADAVVAYLTAPD